MQQWFLGCHCIRWDSELGTASPWQASSDRFCGDGGSSRPPHALLHLILDFWNLDARHHVLLDDIQDARPVFGPLVRGHVLEVSALGNLECGFPKGIKDGCDVACPQLDRYVHVVLRLDAPQA